MNTSETTSKHWSAFEYLPQELIEIILCRYEDITTQDIVNFSSTCSYFHNLVDNKRFWRLHFYRRWPHLRKVCADQMYNEELDFKELVKLRIKCSTNLLDYLKVLNKKFFGIFEYKKLKHCGQHACYNCIDHVYIDNRDLDFLIYEYNGAHPMNYYFLLDELSSIFQKARRGQQVNLTNIYYAEKFFSYLKHHHLKSVWQEFINHPAKQQLLEEAITFFAQWMQPEKNISYSDIDAQLDNIVQKVMKLLKIKYSTHPIFSASSQQFSYWKYNNIDEDQWYFEDGKHILHILCEVLSKQQYLVQASHDMSTFEEYHFINQILRKTSSCIIPMIVIFQSIVRRLGICCNFMSHSDHHLLIWKPKYKTESDNTQCFLINFHQDENVASINMQYSESDNDFTNNYNSYKRIDAIRVIDLVIKCTENLYYGSMHKKKQIRWLYEIQYLIEPNNVDIIMLLYRYYLFYGKSMSILMPTLETIKDTSEDEERAEWASALLIKIEMYETKLSKIYNGNLFTLYQPKRRSQINYKFLIGMIVNGLFKNQWLAGVVIGWLYLQRLLCYIVLCENESVHYFYEDLLELMDVPRAIVNSRIGEYFSEFKETYYVPNETLANAYPDDAHLLNDL